LKKGERERERERDKEGMEIMGKGEQKEEN
jgi:hypothetical protein